ncbi:MAG: VWA domain-containing protein [Desulfobacteraceae bacterium]|nr:MAG: VWA domain-containing protein [Desulfobacteraceae bacterium]
MTGLHLNNIEQLHFLWIVLPLIAVYIYGRLRRKKALEDFIESGLLHKVPVSATASFRHKKMILLVIAVILLVFAMTRPAWNLRSEHVERKGRDVVFLLDVSKSMLAEDLVPNRLERAKLAIMDCVDRLQGDRVALVAFAGTAAVKCPLTLDYGFFRLILTTISTESIERGGTMIGDALRKVLREVLDDQEKEFRDIILITDGEDQESFPVEAAKQAGEKGVRIIAIGLGDETEGKRIPITTEDGEKKFLTYQGREIWTKLDADTLRKMVQETPGGKYLNVATGTIDLGKVYLDLVASAAKKDLESETIQRYEEKFQIFLGIAFILLCVEMVMRAAGQRAKT